MRSIIQQRILIVKTLNPKEFKKLKPPIWKENKWEYFISFSAIATGMFFQYLVLGTDWPESKNNGELPSGLTEIQFASIFFVLYFMGLYGLWRIHAGYKFITLCSALPIDDKRVIVKRAFERMNKKVPEMTGESITFRYKGFLWSVFDVTILLDNENFYINAQSRKDLDGGMVDFGTSYRLMRRIRKNMKAFLTPKSSNFELKNQKTAKS